MPRRYSRYTTVNKERKVLLSDIDGVLADSSVPVLDEVNRKFDLGLKTEDIDEWNFVTKKVTELTGSPEKGQIASQLWFTPEILAKSPVIAGAREAVEELLESGWTIWAATARNPECEESTREWMRENFPGIGADRIYIREKETEKLVTSVEIKLAAIGMLGARMYVEDDPVSVEYVADSWDRGLVIAMMDRGWNKKADANLDKYRTFSWDEVLKKAKTVK